MKALLLGGNRFFGRHAAKALLRDGAEVTLLNRGSIDDELGSAVKRIVADRQKEAELARAIGDRKFDVVIDQVCFDAIEAEAACRIFATRTPLYIATSTISVYPLGAELREEDFSPYSYKFTKTVPTKEDYGEAKRQMEAVFFANPPFRVIAPRFPIVCGTDDYTQRLQQQVDAIAQGEPLHYPNPAARMGFIDSREAGESLAFLAKQADFSGPINVTSPDAISMQTLVAWIEDAAGRKAVLREGGKHSPYGVPGDWYADPSRLAKLGFKTRKLEDWLPGLVRELAPAR